MESVREGCLSFVLEDAGSFRLPGSPYPPTQALRNLSGSQEFGEKQLQEAVSGGDSSFPLLIVGDLVDVVGKPGTRGKTATEAEEIALEAVSEVVLAPEGVISNPLVITVLAVPALTLDTVLEVVLVPLGVKVDAVLEVTVAPAEVAVGAVLEVVWVSLEVTLDPVLTTVLVPEFMLVTALELTLVPTDSVLDLALADVLVLPKVNPGDNHK
ncbi:hypothetical protein H920_13541 [Fukomys damarensis]|uniref:Uncharacterized protein n=1 Tax=Fukomys damarensis TaxID=885580 RepID=A0A091CZ49_FUKDA|nr:hypothetical protein H920_13541 [Fukomys damarensis]